MLQFCENSLIETQEILLKIDYDHSKEYINCGEVAHMICNALDVEVLVENTFNSDGNYTMSTGQKAIELFYTSLLCDKVRFD